MIELLDAARIKLQEREFSFDEHDGKIKEIYIPTSNYNIYTV